MFDHVDIAVSDLAASRRFYVEALGLQDVDGEWVEWSDFGIREVDDEHPLTRRLHVGFGVEDREAVDRWWQRLTEAGYESDGEPGPRPQYSPSYYGAFVLDPDGNSIEAVHGEGIVEKGIDHLWFRTRDPRAAKSFYETIAATVGLELRHDSAERASFSAGGRQGFSFVAGAEPTAGVHLAFAVRSREAVEAFHAAALAAGYRDNGGPGERPQYHPGYYGAFVLDPDGNNVEAVFHDRPRGD